MSSSSRYPTHRGFSVISEVIGLVVRDHRDADGMARGLLNRQQPITAMLSRIIACCLAALVLAPFTAPFRTCDLALLFGHAPSHEAPLTAPVSTTVMHEDSLVSLPVVAAPSRMRVPLVAVGPASTVADATPAMVSRASEPSSRMPDRAALTAVLRV